jgi:1-acyl-sn-glycerol-3-phosphate acyltransferase
VKKKLARLFLAVLGWKVKAKADEQVKRSVMIAAPHTSNWDFPIALAAFWIMGIDLKFFIKDSYTKGPFGWFFKWAGAIGVNRSKKKNNLTDYAISLLNEKDIVILIPAEGTRKRVEKWRTGFYRIAQEAKVPIALGTLDYGKKEADILGVINPSGNFKKDMQIIQEKYLPIIPKHIKDYNHEIY